MNGKRLINAVYKIAVFSFLLVIAGCKENVGLGESVDTVNPEVSINYPPSGAVIMDSFYIGGECSDDKGVSKISVELRKIGSTSETIGFYPAEIYGEGKKWKILMNQPSSSEDSYNGWTIQDGSYEVNVVAWDEAGRTSGAASRNFDIDNTAPVLVVSNPGVSVKSGRDYSSYGSSFSLEGKVADKHKINKIEVSVFDSEGNAKAGTDVKPFTETNLDSGAVSLLFARNGTTGTLADNYAALYDLSDGHFGTTEKYTCSVTLSDNAAIYKDPDSLTYIAEGNSTSTVFLNDDLNNELLSSRNGLGLAVSALYDVLSLTSEKSYTNGENTKTAEEIFKILEECKIVTKAEDSSVEARQAAAENRLGFTLNPEANPTYSVAGYLLKDANTASSGNTISVSASYGLDQNYLDPKTFKVWIKEYDSLPESSILEEDIAAVEKFAYGISKTSAPADWLCLFSNEEYNSNSQANYTLSVTLDAEKINIQLDKYYVVVLTGKDQEGLEFAQKEIYGFIGTVSGQPPKLEISSPVNLSFVKGSEKSNLEFIGKVENSGSISLSKLTAVLKVEDENKSSDSTVYESSPVTIQYNSAQKQWESSSCLTVSLSGEKGAGEWSFVPSLCADYDKFKAEEQSEKSYLYTLSVTAVAASGHTATAESSVHIDTINPAVEITGITPIVDGTDYKGENDSNLYVNGKISFNGNITETNNIDKGVSYKFLDKNGDVIKTSGGALLEGVFDSRIYKFSKEIDTTEIADGTEFEIVVEAKDVVGNKGSYSSKDYTGGKFYIVDQNSDKPVISLKNADMSVKKEQDVLVNAFDCAYAEASINGSVIDDDGIQSVSVKIYDAYEKLIDESQSFTSKNNSTTFDFKFTIPKNEGLYLIQITAQDKNFKDSETTPYSEQIADKFLILVDNGAPKFTKVEIPDFINSDSLEFTVNVEEKCLDSFDIQLKKDDKEVNAEDFTSKSEDGKSITVTIPADPSHKNDGTWTFTATAYDKLEKSNTTLFGPVVIDTTLPVLEFTEEPSKEFVDKSTSQTYKGSVTESNSGISDVLYCLKGFVNGEEKLTEWETAAVKGGKNSAGNIVNDITFKASIDLEQFDDNSNVTVCFKAIDNAGNETSEMSKSLKLDATKPVVTFASWNDSNPYTKETQFELSGTVTEKNLSSLELFVVKDDGEIKSVETWNDDDILSLSTGNAEEWSYTYNANEDGKYYFVLTAEDKAGLKDSVTSKTVYVDTTGPEFSVDNVENLKNGIYDYSAYTFTGTWSDSLSGTQTLIYSVNGNETSITEFAGQKTWRIENVKLTEGLNTFEFWGKDKNGNESSPHVVMENVMVDYAKPVVSLTYSVDSGAETSSVPSYIANGAVLKVSGTVTETNGVKGVIVKAMKGNTEVASGTSGYSVETNPEAKTFTVTLTGGSASSGEWSFEISAKDNAGRTGETVSFGVNVDVESPVITAANTAGKTYIDRTATNKYSGDLTETGGSGIKGVYWKAVQEEEPTITSVTDFTGWSECAVNSDLKGWSLSADLSALTEGEKYTIYFAAQDNAGNISELQSVKQILDNTAPALTELSSVFTPKDGETEAKQTLSLKITEKYLSSIQLEITKGGVKDEAQSFIYSSEDTEGKGKEWFDRYESGKEYSFEISGNGSYVVKLTAADEAGNKTTETFESFIIDTTGPTVTVDDSNITEIFDTSTYTFTGSWSDDVTGTDVLYYSIDGTQPVEETGKYPVTKYAGQTNWRIENVALTEGVHTFEFWGTDKNGNESDHVTIKDVTVDFARPVAALTYEVDGQTVQSVPSYIKAGSTLKIKGTVTETNGVKSINVKAVKNGTEVTDGYTLATGSDNASFTITLEGSSATDGKWEFEISATDGADRTGDAVSTSTVVDTVKPVIAVTKEPSKLFADKSVTQVYEGTITEENSGIDELLYRIKGLVNGTESETEWDSAIVKVAEGITFKVAAELAQFDENTDVKVYFKATDNAGNESDTVEKALSLDATKPVVSFTSLLQDYYTKETSISLSGTITEKNLASLVLSVVKDDGESKAVKTWTEEETAALSTGKAEDWSFDYDTTGDGEYYFVLTATDKAGLTGTATSKTVYRDTAGPTVTVDQSGRTAILGSEKFTFTGTWSDNLSGTKELYYSIDEGTASAAITDYAGQSKWSVEISLTEDKHTFKFWGKDNLGNTSAAVTIPDVMVDFKKPAVTSLTYKVGEKSYSSMPAYIGDNVVLTVSGTIDETNGVKSIDVTAKKGEETVTTNNCGYTLATDTTNKTFTITLAGKEASKGDWTFDVSAKDIAEQTSDKVTLSTAVDTVKPVITAANDAGKKYIDRTATNKYSGNLTETGGSGIKGVYWKAVKLPAEETADTSDIASWSECSVNAGHTGWNLTADLSGLEEGEGYRIFFAAVDNAGNISELKYVDQYLDNTAPKVEELPGSDGVGTKTLSAKITEKYLSELSLEVTKGGVKDEEQSFTYRFNDTEGKGKDWFKSYVSGSEYSFTISGDGSYVVKLTATDKAGNKTTETFESFIIDTTGPVVSVDQAGTSQILDSRTYTFTGSWSDDVTGTDKLYYRVNGTEPAAESGKYPVTKYAGQTNWRIENVELTEGLNTFEFWGKDKNGNESSHVKMENVMVDFAKPVVSLTYSVDGGAETSSVPSYIADGAVLTVSGTVTETNGVKAVNVTAKKGESVIKSGSNGYSVVTKLEAKTFTVTLTGGSESSGEWSFEISAEDNAERTGETVSFGVNVDVEKPVITAANDAGKKYIDRTATNKYSGNLTETGGSGIKGVYWKAVKLSAGETADTSDIASWSECSVNAGHTGWNLTADLSGLEEGEGYRIFFAAQDNAGNISETKYVDQYLDNTAPKVENLTSSYGVETKKQTLKATITEKYLSELALEVTKGGVKDETQSFTYSSKDTEGKEKEWFDKYISGSEYSFEISGDGSYVVKLTAVDEAGNKTTETFESFIIDTTGPVVTVDSSDTKEIFNARTYTFTGSWSDDVTGTAELYYSVNGTEPAKESGKYPVTKYAGQTNWRIENVALTEGANTFEFWGTDKNGNESAHVKMENVMVDFAEPVVSLTYQVGGGETTSSVPSFIADRAVLTVSGTVTESNGVKAVNVTAKKGGIEVTSGNNGYSVETNLESKTFTITLTGGNESSGEWSFDVEAIDNAGRPSSVSNVKTSVDMTPPQWLNSWGTNDENKFKVDNKEYDDKNWYSGAALSFNGAFLEAGSGVDQIYYLVIPAGDSDSDPTLSESNYTGTITVTGDSNNYWVFNSAISGFKASSSANTVKFMAKDKAGNTSAPQTVTIMRDQIAPAINTDGSTILTNGVLDIKLSGSVSDDASGTASLEITINGIDGFKVKADIGNDRNWTSSLPAKTLATLETGKTYEVWGKATDNAGNISESRIAKLNVDKTPPVVKFSDSVKNQAEQGINGKNNIIGTVEESNVPESLEFFYTLQDPSTALTPEDSNGTPAGWTKIGDTVTSSQQIYNWTVSDFDFTEKSSVLTKTGGTAKIYILPVAVDEAGNCNAYTKDNAGSISWNLKPSVDKSEVAQWLEFNVDASLDRPLITFSDLTDNSNKKDATSLIIKNSDGGIITGLAEDDDGIEIIAISSDEISTESGKTFADLFKEDENNPGTFKGKTSHPYTVSSETVNGYDKFIYKNGSFEFHPANPLDGKKTIYIYVKDKAGGEFYSTYSANTGYTVQKNPRIKIKTGNVLDNTKKIEYTSDCTSPVVSSIKIATGDSANAESLNQYSWESGRKIGGTKEKFVKFQVEASDSNGIKTVSLKLKQGSREKTLTVSGSETFTSSKATFTSAIFDLSAFTTGEITVTATATDQTGMSGNSVILPYADFEVEESGFSVISPAATESEGKLVSDDILTSSLTISGSATESSGCGIETVQWMVQPKVDGNAVTVDQIKSSPSTYESNWSTGKSSATYTQWKFIFDGDTDSVTTETSGGTEISHYPKFEKITSNTADYNITTENGICKIPLFFKVTDKLGNVAYIDSYVLRYNPDADRPNAKILYPENGKDVGDVIRVNGSAEDNVSVSKVYIQISTVKGASGIVWNENDEKLEKGRTSAGEDSSYLKTVTLAESGIKNFPEGMSTDWWGIEASGTISWSYSINRYGEFNSELVNGKDNGTKVYLRACSIDNHGKASVWSDVVEFTVYSGVPKVEFNTIAQFEGDSLSNVSAQNTNYEAGSYLTNANGQWYLVVNASHESGISNTSVSCSTQGSPMTKQTDVSAITGSGDGKYSSYYAEEVAGSGSVPNYKLYIPVDTRYEGDVTYTVTATDNTEGLKNNTQSYTYKIDNIAPKIGELTSGNTRNPANTAVAGNKLVNSDGGSASIKSVVKEDISGFTMMAYYFVRNGKIYNPFPGTDGSKFIKQTQTGVKVNVEADVDGDDVKFVGGQKLYGATVTGEVGNDGAGVYFKASASFTDTDKSNIRSGGLILIEGIYYQISKIDDTNIDNPKIYVKGLSENSKATEAFCPYALVIQYNAEAGDTTESITSGSYSEGYTVNEKDGDGIVETVNKVGTDYTLETNIMSDSIPDGEIEIVCIAFDKAGNTSSSSTKTMISNNLPRVSKVYLATDLNQDKKFEKDEFVWYSKNNGIEVPNYFYSCLDSSGNGQEIVTLTTKDSRLNQFTVKDKLALTMELLTGGTTDNSYEGLSYIAQLGNEAASSPKTGVEVTGSLTDSVTGVENTVSQKGILFENSTFTSYEGQTPYLQLTLWDKVNITADENGKYIATVDEKDANGIISSYGNQYTVINIPVAVDITDDVAPKGTITPFYWKKAGSSEGKVNDGSNSVYYSVTKTGESPNYSYSYKPFGHIELGETPEVSGTVVLTGKVSDDQLMNKVEVSFTLGNTDTTISATYDASKKTWTPDNKTVTAEGYQLIMSSDELTQAGHKAEWTLYLDTAKLGNAAEKTVKVKVTQAKDASDTANNTSTPGNTQTTVEAETGYYKMKVVPYITGIVRSGTTNRSRFGRYAVEEGEEITVKGFNFGTSGNVQVGSNTATSYTCTSDSSAESGATSFTMTVPSKSGGVVVTSGETSSTNNDNDNDGHGEALEGTTNSYRLNYYNREAQEDDTLTTDYTDDRYLSVWALGNYFKGTDGGVELQKPVMTADKSGNLYASWVAQSNSNVMFSYGVKQNTTPIFRCYDQPATYTGISFDTKGTSGGANVAFIPEHQGSGGTFSSVGMASNYVVGGMGAIQIKGADMPGGTNGGTNGKVYGSNALVVNVDGNPTLQLDGTNSSSYYSLESYDMSRRLGSFENPKSARYGNYLHNIWYDNVNESLHYSVLDTNNEKKFKQASGAVNGWVVIDGGFTGRDRLHEFGITTATTSDKETTSPYNNQIDSHERIHSTVYKTDLDTASRTIGTASSYSANLFLRAKGKTANDNAAMIASLGNDKKSLTLDRVPSTTDYKDVNGNTVSVTFTPAVGDTIALFQNSDGNYKVTLDVITAISDDKKTYSWKNAVSHDINTATIYGGNMNVVGGSATRNFSGFSPTGQSSSAGLSADIDVTSDGKPVVAYYDAANSKLKVAYASVAEPKLAANWKRVDTGLTCSGEVSMRVDGKNGIHIMFKDKKGQMCYAYAASTSDLGSMKAEVIDTNGTLAYGSISVIEKGTTVVPTVTYLNVANTEDCIKYAYRTAAAGTAGEWDYLIVPSKGSGHFAIAENKISLESKKAGWTTSTTDTVLTNGGTTATPATVDSVIAFKSKQFETAYLKSE